MNIIGTVSLWNKMKPSTTSVIYIVKIVLRNKMSGGSNAVKSAKKKFALCMRAASNSLIGIRKEVFAQVAQHNSHISHTESHRIKDTSDELNFT